MSIQSEITRIKNNIDNTKIALENAGAEVPEDANSDNLSSIIVENKLSVDLSIDATALAADLMEGKTAVSKSEIITGTFTIDNEITTQDDLISQINAALKGKAMEPSGEEVTAETNTYTAKLEELETAITELETELQGKASGGGSIEAWSGTITGVA